MTDQEKISNASIAGGSAVVLVEKTTASRHKSYRPTDLPDDAQVELHHKRSRAPAVPSVAEEYKDSTENTATKQRKEIEHAKSSEKLKHIVAKISSKRATSPEAIPMAPIEVDVQRADILPPATQPIPAPVGPVASDISTTKEVSENEDSITEEIAELRTAESSHKEWDNETENKNDVPPVRESEVKIPLQRKLASGTINEGIASTNRLKKKEISWAHPTYLENVQLQNLNTGSVAWMLDRKASIGPCFRKTLPYGEPSGISICLPKKSLNSCNEIIKPKQSGGISITVSKRSLDNKAKLSSDFEMRKKSDRIVYPPRENQIDIKIEEGNCVNYLENLKERLDNWRGKIKRVLHM